MNDSNDSGISMIVAIVGILAIAVVAYFAVQFLSQKNAEKQVIEVNLPVQDEQQ